MVEGMLVAVAALLVAVVATQVVLLRRRGGVDPAQLRPHFESMERGQEPPGSGRSSQAAPRRGRWGAEAGG